MIWNVTGSLRPSSLPGLFAVLLLVAASGYVTAESRDIVEEARRILNEGTTFRVNISLAEPKPKYKVGDDIQFKVVSERDGYLSILSIGTSGKVTVLYPNEWTKSGRVEKGKTYLIPPADGDFAIAVSGPAGSQYVKAIVTEKPLVPDYDSPAPKGGLSSAGPFRQPNEPGKMMKDIGQEVTQLDRNDWSVSELSFQIVEQDAGK
jgi:hypothetical protein